MSTASVMVASESQGRSRSLRVRRGILIAAGVLLLVAIAVLVTVLSISTASDGEVSILVGPLDSDRLASLALVVAVTSIALGLCVIPVSRRWLLLMIPARFAAIALAALVAFVSWMSSTVTVVPLLADGCETGYVVQEESFLRSGSGTVYRPHGLIVTAVAQTSGDDGYRPFQDGAYAVVDDGRALRVWYADRFDYYATPVTPAGEPAVVLPKLTRGDFSCGLSTGARDPLPSPSAAPVHEFAEAEAAVREMAAASFSSVVGPLRTPAGTSLDPQTVTPVVTACDEGGSRVGVAFEFTTADNEESLARILRVWDDAGYESDRAMQDDIRWSNTLPVKTMTIRDSTSIDGLIRMQITSQCARR